MSLPRVSIITPVINRGESMGQSSDRNATRQGDTANPGDLIHENDVYDRFPGLFADRELREARQAGQIRWFDLRKGPHFTEVQLMEYLATKERMPCRNEKLDEAKGSPRVSSKSGTTGSSTRKTATITPIAGMTPALERSAAELLDKQT